MQGKGLVKFFCVALLLVCLYQLAFTFFTNRVENRATDYAEARISPDVTDKDKNNEIRRLEKLYLDSISEKPVVNLGLAQYTYKESKANTLNLGLDLQGGMSVVMQVALEEAIKSMSGNSTDPAFLNALDGAKKAQANSEEDFVTLFGQEFNRQNTNTTLAQIFSRSSEYKDKITFNSSNEEVLRLIKEESQTAVETTFEIIRTRIDKFGVTNPNISLQKSSGRIIVELPGVDDPERVRKLLQAEANLEIWETFTMSNDLVKAFESANTALKNKRGLNKDTNKTETSSTTESSDTSATSSEDGLLNTDNGDGLAANDSINQSIEDFKADNPLFAIFQPTTQGGSGVLGTVSKSDVPKFKKMLEEPEVKAALPRNMKMLLDQKATEYEDNNGDAVSLYRVYGIKSRTGDTFIPPLDGGVITNARSNVQQNGQVEVQMTMNQEGARKWKTLTRENIQRPVAIVLDNEVYSAPIVQSEIGGGSTQITGDFSITEGQDLANILKIGKLPAPARIVEEAIVGPTLGKASVRSGLFSLLAGLVMVLGFMVFYYNKGGIVSVIALILNLFFIIGILASLGATLTLPGIAGIVLTIGMAVDANVIIYERIREELHRGLGMKNAIKEGFSKSYSAIIDANLTTLITAIILAYFGLGPVLGFATILIIGIFSSLFTAVLLTRLIIDWRMDKGDEMKFASGLEFFKDAAYDFVSNRKRNYIISGIVIALGIGAIFARGFELGVDFEGGRTYTVNYAQTVNTQEIANSLAGDDVFGQAPLVTTYGGNNQVKITTNYEIDNSEPGVSDRIEEMIYNSTKGFVAGAAPSLDSFKKNNIMSSQKVGPTIADDITRGAFYATIFALLGIFLYILIRFRKWQFGLAAVLTVIHDTLILLSIFAIFHGILPFGMEINQAFIAALLTVIGYSINDTVVVFDRIREYLIERKNQNSLGVINDAINSTLSRTIITSVTTLFVVFMLFVFGGEVIRGFSFALLIGIIVGTYSSIFVATPLVIDLSKGDVKINIPQPREEELLPGTENTALS